MTPPTGPTKAKTLPPDFPFSMMGDATYASPDVMGPILYYRWDYASLCHHI